MQVKKNKIDGWLFLDKPTGIGSNKAIGKIKRILRPQKIGFVGTLDPLATGILPIALGEATKTIPYARLDDKTYIATIKFGSKTSTDDIEGEVLETSDIMPELADINNELKHFRGEISQIPPKFSAVHIDGKRAYDLARDNQEFEIKPRNVTIYDLQLLKYNAEQQELELLISCSKGTYIRSIARDLGDNLGCFGHITALRRVKMGKIEENFTFSLDYMEKLLYESPDSRLWLHDLAVILDDIPVLQIDINMFEDVHYGRKIKFNGDNKQGDVALIQSRLLQLCFDNKLVAIAKPISPKILQPIRVFNY